ncbi:MAG: 23S rRNA (pseudouridine(1915)-N(3))-methyltransferase RlmH [Saprospiraceae bacterium]|nr:23S rRNA (pseudouridine(1915)-N(3))-methyltransferase RlmH [Saprospiraceae bacterium]
MKVELWAIGKTNEKYLETGIEIFEKRLSHYLPFKFMILPDVKTKLKDPELLKTEEGKMLLARLQPDDHLVLLDENGKEFSSVGLSEWLEKRLAGHGKKMVFVIGGAFGFSPDVYARAHEKLALSKLTFSHQMVRLFFLEQLYRAMTILKNEPYHNN